MTTAHTLTYRVTRGEALDTGITVWSAIPMDVPPIGGVTGRHLAELQEEAEAAAWFVLGVSQGTEVTINYVYDLDEHLAADLDQYREAAAQAKSVSAAREAAAIRVAKQLAAAGISERDGALIMGLSKQRVHQLKHAG
ncbi:hypothetical protein [Streptosporangium subroseum]|uniref:hypothetical protein n=1 Tax=Streptosporangium subroseum TaxID=106412 RepID=UPI003088EC27|nr:hypothetical protein OHB15_38135 [Streptosporangium subroseum]